MLIYKESWFNIKHNITLALNSILTLLAMPKCSD